MRASRFCVVVLLAAAVAYGQGSTASRTNNPNYPTRNPFYFEGKIQWELLGIDTPINEWEFLQRGIHKQDDLQDTAGAIADYQTALQTNSLSNNTCQIVTQSAPPANLTPPPCMFTVRLRLGVLLMQSNPTQALSLFQDVLKIDPLRLGVNSLIGETYQGQGDAATDPTKQAAFYQQAIAAYQAELAMSPVTAQYTQLTGDTANNAHVHWQLAEIYRALGQAANEKSELSNYLAATQWHSDTYPWRITLANARLKKLNAMPERTPRHEIEKGPTGSSTKREQQKPAPQNKTEQDKP